MVTGVLAPFRGKLMTDEKKPKEKKKPVEPETEESILATAAKAIGTAAGKIAALAGVAPSPPKVKKPKLQKKNKSRLPRRQKKARQKAAATQGEV